jgi:hypothetical protein
VGTDTGLAVNIAKKGFVATPLKRGGTLLIRLKWRHPQ